MNELGRLFLAFAVSISAILAWDHFYVAPKMEAKKLEAQKVAEQNAAAAPQAKVGEAKVAPSEVVKSQDTASVKPFNPIENVTSGLKELELQKPRKEIVEAGYASKQRVKLSNELLHGSINLVGGMIDDITLATYHETLDDSSPEVVLLSPRKTDKLFFLNTNWLNSGGTEMFPDDNSVWQLESGSVLTPTSPVTIKFSNGAGLTFRKTFSIDDKYMLSVKQSVENKSATAVNAAPFGLINRTYDTKQKQVYVSHEGLLAVGDKKLNETKYKDLVKNKSDEMPQVSGWIAITDKYWLSAIIPQNSGTEKFDMAFKYYQKDNIDRFQNDILSKAMSVAPNSSAEYNYNIYLGAKKLSMLEEYQDKLKIDLFDRAIDFGGLYFMTKPIFKLLTYFHHLIGNMGLAIMLLTVTIRLILFPLANMSYKSMARMKKHMPEINKLKEKNKNDRQKQGMDMMKYYKEHKINPAAGCAPILVQIPVFFSLYKVLYVTIEMRHAGFFWFMHDLSATDPTNIFTLFGLVAWTVPAWIPHIGILPILFSLSMMVQQKLNPPMADETQRIVMQWMPWIFLFLFANFASGLVIYWIWNNTLSILQQWLITKKINADKNE